MAVRKTSGKMQKTLNDLKQERDVIAQAIDQLQSLLDVLKGGGAKKRGRPKKVATKPTKRAKIAKVTKKRVTKKAGRKTTAKKAVGRPKKKRASSR